MAQDRALARGVLNHTPGSFTTKMRAVARGKAEHEASHTVMALHYGQAIRAVTIDPAQGGQGAMYRWQPKETPTLERIAITGLSLLIPS